MTSGFLTRDLVRGLAVRVLLYLSLALLPIGLIAIVQARQINEQSKANAELSLLAVTERISAAEESVLQEAFGAVEALGTMVRLRRHDDAECSAFLAEYKVASRVYDMVGFVGADGMMRCSSGGGVQDFSDDPNVTKALASAQRRAVSLGGSDHAVTVVSAPVHEGAQVIGLMMIAIPFSTFQNVDEPELPLRPLAMLTFNQDGNILTSEKGFGAVGHEVPTGGALPTFSGKDAQVFHAQNAHGDYRAYAVLPLVPDAVFAMSVWPADTPFLKSKFSARLSALLPIFMWVASLIVAFWALNRLAITHIRKLVRQMRRFAINRMLPRETLSPGVPTELVDMERAFMDMAESIIRDEAAQENSLREKNILLKEVHHRVKNNLQLISSIMNMQIRQAKGDDAKFVLRRLQDRILSLATVHENLYQNDSRVRVEASALLNGTVSQVLSVGLAPGSHIKVTQHYDKIILDPDDAVSLTLLVSEAMTNALKYVSAAKGEQGRIAVDLRYEGDEMARLVIENTAVSAPSTEGTGLGSKLITAFTRQLNGQEVMERTDGMYRLVVTFPVPEKDKPVRDY